MSKPCLLALSGSARRDSLNGKVLAVMACGAEVAGAEVRVVSLGEYPLPIYDGDLEDAQGLPDNAARLQQLFADHDGLLLTSPEYNGFFTPLLKNALDWVSRPLPDGSGQPGTVHVRGKPAGIAAASPGGLGGLRSLQHTRQYLANLGFLVVPEQMGVGQAGQAFTDGGELRDEDVRKGVEGVGAAVARLAMAVRGG
ncbi:NAD(P)H-dependent FMN reductase [Ectothiorhodospira magna]|uniref:NAD(P)H-dependent FMN reductase n=1 Tax=Ectothiorhodospira magna TaxID=867345 RepID=A0A1H8ZAJ4_9GAMM|nr:NAD(P)H-dependent oxidoreductase [Ectothiorhodospira magna]SEP61361.1 NAD(P)H-dependent FMN reductase [Ectothiorhodospira magna]